MSKVSDTFLKILSAFSLPIPVKLSIRLRLAFLKLPLNMYGILSLSVSSQTCSAIRIAIASPSIAHGPASKKN